MKKMTKIHSNIFDKTFAKNNHTCFIVINAHWRMMLILSVIAVFLNCFHVKEKTILTKYEDFYPELNKYYSEKPLGVNISKDSTIFRLFSPRAISVTLIIFPHHDATAGDTYSMKKDCDGVWEYKLSGKLFGHYYGYSITGPVGKDELFDPHIIIADPYAKAVVTQNNYQHPAKSIVIDTKYDWDGDTWITTPIEDLVIYEMHVRDMSVHHSSGISQKGTYRGIIEKGKKGGLDYLLDLGINAVELLPVHEFANIEIPYKDSSISIYNTWNPYERNHWGYMTSYFFAPESYYASSGNMTYNSFNGIDGKQVNELKDMIKELHRHGIAVILDVVYNHVSQYDFNPFKYIDKKYYFRLDSSGAFTSQSGCGNDFMTDRPMSRKMILESVKYWMTEYHIDGFRFDLANLIDETTCKDILREARKINPNVYIIAEPWGGGYNPAGFSELGWAAWNDKFRNGVKGQNPNDNLGFIFGKWERENSPVTIKRYATGTLVIDGGLFQQISHAVNYLESHDDHTLGDFIRIGSGEFNERHRVYDMIAHVKLSDKQLKLNKLAAVFLFTSQGPIMLGQGQEFARSKIIAQTSLPDTNQGRIDNNSYNKDNDTNYINYQHKEINNELYKYYKALIALRRTHPAFRNTRREDIRFLNCQNEFGIGFMIKKHSSHDTHDFIVLMNGHQTEEAIFSLPEGKWDVVVNEKIAGIYEVISNISGSLKVPPTTGMILKQ